MADDAQIAALQANYANIDKALAGLTGEVRAGNLQNAQIISAVAVLDSKQQANTKYQDECDAERKEIRSIVNEHENALTGIKTRAGLISAFTSIIVASLTAILVAIIGMLHK